ncbi:hypothetical protein [Zunongwangia endophytica]|uniref:Uncharacterized protein n=1 Tax=Zunongwangia endophytica TaxID=1808945 RepID=A0ABV8HCE9_9FLAO|nr:hypothetical protein [Zunongwangia endophytica]MDN3594189.1 hypothetical protein [Zunongwangia endophytica]
MKSIIDNKLKRYLFYAIGELCLIVLGILVALYINNRNANNQYKKQIDNNLLRAYSELEGNIEEAQETILKIKEKDSLIYLVMNDLIEPEAYYKDINLAYLILFFYNLNIEDKAFQNLISINVADNKYKEELLSSLKELYSINENIKEVNQRMSTFVYDKSLPMLAKNTKTFGDLTYKGEIKKDVVDFFITSLEYKSYVSQYAIIAIKNQLKHNQDFLKKAYSLRSKMTNEYNLDSKNLLKKDSLISQYKGLYSSKTLKDTIAIKFANDSILFYRNKEFQLNLIPLTKDCYFTDNEGGGYFVSFLEKKDTLRMELNLLSNKYLYEKIKK